MTIYHSIASQVRLSKLQFQKEENLLLEEVFLSNHLFYKRVMFT